ncbi:MAG: holo-ACP synthase [Actinomycetota bacterium]|nr:holo-ACP synthase [Actinomycetota bacterium]
MLQAEKGSGIITQRLPFSVGIDIVSIDRIDRAFRRHPSFATRILTDGELAEMILSDENNEQFPPPIRRNVEFLAARFAVKEAASKALRINLFSVSFHDFVVTRHPIGYPTLGVSDVIQRRFSEMGEISFEVSISHERSYAIAVVNSFISKGDDL